MYCVTALSRIATLKAALGFKKARYKGIYLRDTLYFAGL